jgi:hypothetical protein
MPISVQSGCVVGQLVSYERQRGQKKNDVLAATDRFGQQNASRVHSLENAVQVHTTSDLPDQNRRHSLGPKNFVYAQKVDFDHLDDFLVNSYDRWNATNKTDQFAGLLYPDGHMPVRLPCRRFQSPTQELRRIIEAEHVVIVFHVIFGQQRVQFFELHSNEVRVEMAKCWSVDIRGHFRLKYIKPGLRRPHPKCPICSRTACCTTHDEHLRHFCPSRSVHSCSHPHLCNIEKGGFKVKRPIVTEQLVTTYLEQEQAVFSRT